MPVLFADAAARDLEAIVAYIADHNRQSAEDVYRAIAAAARQLDRFPALGRPGRIDGTRELVVGQSPYILVYAVDGADAVIVAVFHGSRDFAAAMAGRALPPETR
ncbi:MAG: type II toxin-antitoxin system RelE/ParE family toxin [Rhodospirillales bacterium]|nr:type II toxin-antitoxin system RelE/ParE family toxin [Rhodospirillales bacterium]